MNKKIGIVTINWNNYYDTKDFIESILNIDYNNYILIIVDNNSTDDSYKKLKDKYKGSNESIIFIKNQSNKGFAGGNNVGIEFALNNDCDSILIINNDTIVESDFLNNMVSKLYSEEKIGVVSGKIYYYNNKNKLWSIGGKINLFKASAKYYGVDQFDKGQFDDIENLGLASGCLMLVKNEVFKEIGLFSEKYFFRGEEWDFGYRVKSSGYRISFAPKAKIYHKVSQSHERLSYSDIYSAYRAKLIFSKSYLKNPIWGLWFIIFVIYSLTFSYINFNNKKSLKYSKFILIIYYVINDHFKKDVISSSDIDRIKDILE